MNAHKIIKEAFWEVHSHWLSTHYIEGIFRIVGQSDRHNWMPVCVCCQLSFFPTLWGLDRLSCVHYAGELNMHRFEGLVWSNRYKADRLQLDPRCLHQLGHVHQVAAGRVPRHAPYTELVTGIQGVGRPYRRYNTQASAGVIRGWRVTAQATGRQPPTTMNAGDRLFRRL